MRGGGEGREEGERQGKKTRTWSSVPEKLHTQRHTHRHTHTDTDTQTHRQTHTHVSKAQLLFVTHTLPPPKPLSLSPAFPVSLFPCLPLLFAYMQKKQMMHKMLFGVMHIRIRANGKRKNGEGRGGEERDEKKQKEEKKKKKRKKRPCTGDRVGRQKYRLRLPHAALAGTDVARNRQTQTDTDRHRQTGRQTDRQTHFTSALAVPHTRCVCARAMKIACQ